MIVNSETVKSIILDISKDIEDHKEYLTELDAAIGDGDHGSNLSKGFRKVSEKLSKSEFKNIGDVLKATAMDLISTVGGASGPLYGSFFLKAGAAMKDKQEMNFEDLCNMFDAATEGVKSRGKSDINEKTMLDVLIPVSKSFRDSLSKNLDIVESLKLAVDIAHERCEFTKTIIATKGRASYLGERSIGHIDPGAMSSTYMIETLYSFFSGDKK